MSKFDIVIVSENGTASEVILFRQAANAQAEYNWLAKTYGENSDYTISIFNNVEVMDDF